jgi:hypothetical protein
LCVPRVVLAAIPRTRTLRRRARPWQTRLWRLFLAAALRQVLRGRRCRPIRRAD